MAPSDLTAAEVTKIVREELDRGNKTLEFVQSQIDKDRNFFKHLLGITTLFLSAVIGVGGWFSFSSLEQLKSNVRDSVRAELDVSKAELAAVKANATATIAEVRAEARLGLDNVRVEVQKRVDKEFDSVSIRRVVSQAATESAKGELNTIIRTEAANQVAAGLRKEEATIQRIVKDTTTSAVADMHPLIEATVTRETARQVDGVLGPLQGQLAETVATQKVERASAEAVYAFSNRQVMQYLWEVTQGLTPESKYPLAKDAASRAIAPLMGFVPKTVESIRTQNYDSVDPIRLEQLRVELFSNDFGARSGAVQMFPPSAPGFVDLFLKVIRTETSWGLTIIAATKLGMVSGCAFDAFHTAEILEWDKGGRLVCRK